MFRIYLTQLEIKKRTLISKEEMKFQALSRPLVISLDSRVVVVSHFFSQKIIFFLNFVL